MSTVCRRLHLQLGGCPSGPHSLSLSSSLSFSLSLCRLLSLFSWKLRLLRRLARIFKYTRVLSLPLNHIFILYLFAVPPSTCSAPHPPHPSPPFCPPPGTPTRRPLASQRWHFDCLHFALSRRKQTQQTTKNGAKYCEKTTEKKYETKRRRAEDRGMQDGEGGG